MKYIIKSERIRIKKKAQKVRRWFAFLPVEINNEGRWLEYVTVKGYWYEGVGLGWWYWENEKFID